jgi:predicted esterase
LSDELQSPPAALRHIERPPAGVAVGALVFFHGYSGDPANFVAFLNEIDPERRFHGYLPEAPYPGEGDRTSWFDRGSAEPAEKQLAAVVEWLDGLPYKRERTVVGGLSQGANVAYSVGLGARYARPAGVIALAGGFRNELPPDLERPPPPIAIAHGRADESAPVSVARYARDVLERAGATVLYRETDSGHGIDEAVIPDLRVFLAKLP